MGSGGNLRVRNWRRFQHFRDRRPPWIKVYRDLLNDPDWHALDGETAKVLVELWLIAAGQPDRDGRLPPEPKLAFQLRRPLAQVRQAIGKLSHWLEQDDIKSISPRFQLVPPETETETETETQASEATRVASADEVVGEDARAKLFRIGKTVLVSFGVAEKRTGALIGQWLKTRNDPVGLLAAIQFARDQNVAEPVAYISTVLKQEKFNGPGQKPIGERAKELADEWRRREHDAGLFRPPDDAGSH